MQRTAIITGITGQDGSYLAEYLLAKGYQVHGVIRAKQSPNLERISHIIDRIRLHCVDLQCEAAIQALLERVEPDEFYSLAAMSFVPQSWERPVYTAEITGLIALRVMEAIRRTDPDIRFYHAGSSEVFGRSEQSPQNELTPMRPSNPYAIAKTYAHHCVKSYRENWNLFACTGILFNHESPRRPVDFVTRKITQAAARIKLGVQNELSLGNLDACRDWGFAGDYVESMWLMLQRETPDDFVIGTGIATRVGDFVDLAFSELGLDASRYVTVNPKFFRPVDPHLTLADPSKAESELGWKPKTTLKELVSMMVQNDLKLVTQELTEQPLSRAA